jgi:hypothetical protein
MTRSSQKREFTAVNKTNPGAGGKKFIPMPSDMRHYIHHELMKAEKLFLYAILIDYYNVDMGFAWPSLERLAVDYGKTSKTTGGHLRDLEKVGLIAIVNKGRYVPLDPLPAEKFYAMFPHAWESYKQAIKAMDERMESDSLRLSDYREKQRTRK